MFLEYLTLNMIFVSRKEEMLRCQHFSFMFLSLYYTACVSAWSTFSLHRLMRSGYIYDLCIWLFVGVCVCVQSMYYYIKNVCIRACAIVYKFIYIIYNIHILDMTYILDVSMHIIYIYVSIVLLYHRTDESVCGVLQYAACRYMVYIRIYIII